MPDGAPPVDGETLEQLYGKLWLTRRFEEVVAEIYPTDKIKSPVHLSIGQEVGGGRRVRCVAGRRRRVAAPTAAMPPTWRRAATPKP